MTSKRLPLCLSAIVTLTLFCGCEKTPQGLEPDKLACVTPETVLGPPGAVIQKGCKVELVSKPVRGLLGGEGEARPVAGVKLVARAADPSSGLVAIPEEAVTDAGGNVTFDVRLGNTFGDQYLDVSCADTPGIMRRVRFVAGVAVENGSQEVTAGRALDKPIRVRLVDGSGAPLADTPVFFTLAKQPGKNGKLSKSQVATDAGGVAEVELLTDAAATGSYQVRAEVAAPRAGISIRPIVIDAMAMNVTDILIAVFGGLAFFIYGMVLMSDGLQQIAGNKMKATLAFITRNRIGAILTGTFVTALIQSSSATTVMTVGFVNAGLLSLTQAIGVVFGANIGTTVTGQIVSLKLDSLALPSIILGLTLLLVARKNVLQGTARTVLGFGLLFFGMMMMSQELKAISAFPTFVQLFQRFDCTPALAGGEMPLKTVLGAVGIGTVVTMLVQSSSATIGLVIALANSGLLNFWTAFPIVLGCNIGTTITAVLAALSANRTAKQTAAAHAIFNILGTALMVALFYVPYRGVPCFLFLVNHVAAGDVFAGENIGRHVAMAHTIASITKVSVMIPFIGGLAWICEKIVPGKKAPVTFVQLETTLLNTPSLAMVCTMKALADMTETAWDMALEVLNGYRNDKPVSVDDVKVVEDKADRMQNEIMSYLVQLTRKKLSETQAQAIPLLMHCVNDAERIADLAYLIARRADAEAANAAGHFTGQAIADLNKLIETANTVADMTLDSLRKESTRSTENAKLMLKTIKDMARQALSDHVDRTQEGICNPQRGMVYVEVIAAIENIVRHLENIVERAEIVNATT